MLEMEVKLTDNRDEAKVTYKTLMQSLFVLYLRSDSLPFQMRREWPSARLPFCRRSLSIATDTPAKRSGGCSRMTVSPTAQAEALPAAVQGPPGAPP